MYSDVQELYDGGAAHLETELRHAAASAEHSRAASNPTNNAKSGQRRDSSGSGSGSAISGSTLGHQTTSSPSQAVVQHANPLATRHGSAGIGPPGSGRFLLLCVNGPRFARLEQISLIPGLDDQVLFQDIRNAYIKSRRNHTRVFHPDTPAVLQNLVAWMDRCWAASQKLATHLFKMLRLGWLVWWIGDDVFLIPKSANFVRVSHGRATFTDWKIQVANQHPGVCSSNLCRSRWSSRPKFWNQPVFHHKTR